MLRLVSLTVKTYMVWIGGNFADLENLSRNMIVSILTTILHRAYRVTALTLIITGSTFHEVTSHLREKQ